MNKISCWLCKLFNYIIYLHSTTNIQSIFLVSSFKWQILSIKCAVLPNLNFRKVLKFISLLSKKNHFDSSTPLKKFDCKRLCFFSFINFSDVYTKDCPSKNFCLLFLLILYLLEWFDSVQGWFFVLWYTFSLFDRSPNNKIWSNIY